MKRVSLKVLGVIVIIIMIGLQTSLSYAVSQKDIDSIDNQIEEKKEELNNIQTEKSETMKQVEELTSKINDYQAQIDEMDGKIADLNNKIQESEEKINKAQEDYNKQEELLEARLVANYEAGETSFLDVLLSSDSITDLISNYYLVTEIATNDAELLDKIQKEKEEIEKAKQDLENSKKELDTSKAEKQSVAVQLQETKSAKNAKVQELTEDEQAIQKEIDELAEANKSLDAEILRKQQQIQAQLQAQANKGNSSSGSTSTGGGAVSNSGFIYPVPSAYAKITTGLYYSSGQYHGGVDFGSGGINGQPVYAVQEGVVVTAKALNYSYGNHVIIAHPNGLYTLYAHGQAGSIRVSEGQYVSRGQQIMNVGSTGNSTGPHLHFEVRKSPGTYSNRVNPIPYLP